MGNSQKKVVQQVAVKHVYPPGFSRIKKYSAEDFKNFTPGTPNPIRVRKTLSLEIPETVQDLTETPSDTVVQLSRLAKIPSDTTEKLNVIEDEVKNSIINKDTETLIDMDDVKTFAYFYHYLDIDGNWEIIHNNLNNLRLTIDQKLDFIDQFNMHSSKRVRECMDLFDDSLKFIKEDTMENRIECCDMAIQTVHPKWQTDREKLCVIYPGLMTTGKGLSDF